MPRDFPRVQQILIPILREGLPDDVTVTSWVPDIDHRKYPIVNIRRLGGYRDRQRPDLLDKPVVEITTYSQEGIVEAEELYTKVLDVLFEAVRTHKVVDAGYLTFVKETMGMTQFSSLFQDTWRIQGLIQVGARIPTEKE